jgi:transcriptional regulator with XRE-family HTH domain
VGARAVKHFKITAMARYPRGGEATLERLNMQVLGQVVKKTRWRRGLTQEQLSDASGIHVNHISGIERGIRSPSVIVLFQLSRGLGISPVEIVEQVETGIRESVDDHSES